MTDKKINITGTSTRYQIKKVTGETSIVKERKSMTNFTLDDLTWDTQFSLFENVISNKNNDNYSLLIKKEITSKINNYKHQDVIKKVFDERKMITFGQLVDKLKLSGLKCHYCKEEVYLLYKVVREMKQWTLDRIDNNIGHFNDNVVISCLNCNLKRRNKNSDAFLFTKQLHIIKSDSPLDTTTTTTDLSSLDKEK